MSFSPPPRRFWCILRAGIRNGRVEAALLFMADNASFSCLLVDDDAGFASMLATLVAGEGGRPVMCHTVAGAREQFERGQFDLVILDNGLPDGTGYELYPQLVRHNPGTIFAMVTG